MALSKAEWEMLVRIDERGHNQNRVISELKDAVEKKITDHETRVRSLEKKWWATIGAAVLIVTTQVLSLIFTVNENPKSTRTPVQPTEPIHAGIVLYRKEI